MKSLLAVPKLFDTVTTTSKLPLSSAWPVIVAVCLCEYPLLSYIEVLLYFSPLGSPVISHDIELVPSAVIVSPADKRPVDISIISLAL